MKKKTTKYLKNVICTKWCSAGVRMNNFKRKIYSRGRVGAKNIWAADKLNFPRFFPHEDWINSSPHSSYLFHQLIRSGMDSMKWNKRLIFACIFISPRKGTYNNGPRPFPANEKCQSANLFCPSASFSEESPRFEINLGMLIPNTNGPPPLYSGCVFCRTHATSPKIIGKGHGQIHGHRQTQRQYSCYMRAARRSRGHFFL